MWRWACRASRPGTRFCSQMVQKSPTTLGDVPHKPRNIIYDPYFDESVNGSRPRMVAGGRTTVTLVPGLGTGMEHCRALMDVFACCGAPVDFEVVEGADKDTKELENLLLAVRRNGLAIKGNIERRMRMDLDDISRNMLVRRKLELFINIQEFKSYPQLQKRMRVKDKLDVVLIRPNTEGDYSMLEHAPLDTMVEHLRITTRTNAFRLAKYAFEYAKKKNRKKITLIHNKDIIPHSEAEIIEAFFETASEFPDIKATEMDASTLSQRIIYKRSSLDVLLCSNMVGSILSSMLLGFLGSAELVPIMMRGERLVLMEQAHWYRFHDYEKKEVNPMSILLCGIAILEEIQAHEQAQVINEGIVECLSEGLLTEDLGGSTTTGQFVEAMVDFIKGKVTHILCNKDGTPRVPSLPSKPTRPFHPDFMPGMSPPEPNYKLRRPPVPWQQAPQ